MFFFAWRTGDAMLGLFRRGDGDECFGSSEREA
jgi:hypothetical protein